MSFQAERGLNKSVHTGVEGESSHDGMWFSLSSVVNDIFPENYTPGADEMYPLFESLVRVVPDEEVGIRSSTLLYKLLTMEGVDRRATITGAIRNGLGPVLRLLGNTKSASALSSMQYFSDLDFFLPQRNAEGFAVLNSGIIDKLSLQYGSKPRVLREGEEVVVEIPTRRKVKKAEKKEPVKIESETGFIAGGIPYHQLMLNSADGQRLGIVCFTAADHGDIFGVKDDRLNPKYALSWDYAAKGRIEQQIPDRVLSRAKVLQSAASKISSPGVKRLLNDEGVLVPALFLKPEDDTWFHVPQQNLDILSRPMDVGEGFLEKTRISQFRQALRATLKGTLSEEIISGSLDGRKALAEVKAPAISSQAKRLFNGIDVDEFRKEFEQLDSHGKKELEKEVMQNMMMGLFYPQRFIEYCNATGVLRFFPQLDVISSDQWNSLAQELPVDGTYAKRQYAATHFKDISESLSNIDKRVEMSRRYNSLANPYDLLFRKLLELYPEKTPICNNAFEALDILLNLDEIEYEKADKDPHFQIFNQRTLMGPQGQEMTQYEFHIVLGANVGATDILQRLELEARSAKRELQISRLWQKQALATGITMTAGLAVTLGSQLSNDIRISLGGMAVGGAIVGGAYLKKSIQHTFRFLDEADRDSGLWDHEIEEEDLPKG